MSSVTHNTLSLWWRLFQVDNPTRMLQIKLMKEFCNGNGLIPGTILQRVVSAGFSPIKSLFTKQLYVNPEVNCLKLPPRRCRRQPPLSHLQWEFYKALFGGTCPGHPFDQSILNLFFRPYTDIWFLSQLIKSVTPVWCYIFSVMVTTVFYCPFLHVFYAAYVFYGTVFMYNHAILCIFSPNLEVEINVIIIIIHHQDVVKKQRMQLVPVSTPLGSTFK